MTFAQQIAELTQQATPEVIGYLAEASSHLQQADEALAAIRAMGFTVTIRHPISARDGMALTRFEVELTVKVTA